MYKVILIPVSGHSNKAALEIGFRLAKLNDAHVIGLHVRFPPDNVVPLIGEGMSGAMIDELINAAEKRNDEQALQAKTIFDSACKTYKAEKGNKGFSFSWFDIVGHEEEEIVLRGRFADLVVLPRPDHDKDSDELLTLNATLMETARPLLLVPDDVKVEKFDHIVLAWNGSVESTRALHSALPVLTMAKKVTIVSLTSSEEYVDDQSGLMLEYLTANSIKAQYIQHTVEEGLDVGESLLKLCQSKQADLLVMGAYTHSRLRQLIFGGVTDYVIHTATLPCLICH